MEGFESPEGYGAPITLDDVTETHMKRIRTPRDGNIRNTAILTYEVCVRGKTRRIRREASPKETRKDLIQASNAMQPMVLVGV